MSPLATVETNKSVSDFIASIENQTKRQDNQKLVEIMEDITGHPAKIWGDNYIVGFGKYTYTRKGGKEEFEWFNVGFAPRKSNLTIYLSLDLSQETQLLEKLGKHKTGKGCLYINKLADIDIKTLKHLITKSKNATWA